MIKGVEITNMRNIEHLVYKAGLFNVISGDNEVGKSTVQDIIAWVLRPELTKSPGFLRNGAKRGEGKLTFDDDNWIMAWVDESGKVGRESSNRGKSELTKYVAGLTNIFLINPEAFRVADPKGKIKILSDILPMSVDWAEVDRIAGLKVPRSNDPAGTIDSQMEKISDERKKIKDFAEDRERTWKSMRRNLPTEKPEPPQLPGALEAEKKVHEDTLSEEKKRIEKTTEDTAKKYLGVRDDAKAEAKKIYDASIAAAEQEYNDAIKRGSDWKTAEISKAEASCSAALEPINKQLGELSEAIKNHDMIMVNWDFAEEKRIEGEEFRKEAEGYTKQLKEFTDLKKTIFDNCEIKDMDIRNGIVHLKNAKGEYIPFDDCSDSQQKAFMGQLARFAVDDSEVPMIRMDEMESCNQAKLDAFRDAAFRSGVQHWVSKFVEGEPLTIVAYNPVEQSQ